MCIYVWEWCRRLLHIAIEITVLNFVRRAEHGDATKEESEQREVVLNT